MVIMEPRNMEETSTENAKISDSGNSNTCSNSQSHASSGSSVSRNINRPASSGYHGGNPSTLGSYTETLPKPISKRKEKAHKKKSRNALALVARVEAPQTPTPFSTVPAPLASSHADQLAGPCHSSLDQKAEEVAVVELVDVTDPGVHNDNLPSSSEAGLASKTCPIDESSSQSTEEYYVLISMHDGLVLHATPSLHASLGYPKDSWTGKLFIDLLDPKDKHIFTERIASEIAVSRDFCQSGADVLKTSIFCRLRSLISSQCDSGNANSQQCTGWDQYVPYRINMVIQNFYGDKVTESQNQVMLLVAFFQTVHSAYKVPEETIIPTVFTTRHTATCRLSYVDPDVVQYLGYLPQDMIDRSLFDFYHPEDLPLIKDIYETVINLNSTSYRSKPYRFIIQNGGFVMLDTEWSSFVNPWTKNVEFVVGHHRVLKGPSDPNIFRSCAEKNGILANISEEVLKEAKIIEKKISELLVEGVRRKLSCAVIDSGLLSKKKELTSFVENILQEIKSPVPIKDHMAVDDRSFSEHDSVMLGEILPHHEYFDSKSSTETLPSYNQLNYNDNIERFFSSNLGASVNNGRPYGSDEENPHFSANSSDDPGKNNISRPELKCTSSTNGSGNSGSGENLSSGSNNQHSLGSGGDTSNTTSNNSTGNGSAKPPMLTKSLLNRHNEDMEKLMVQKHREQKKSDKRNKSSLKDQQVKAEQPTGRCCEASKYKNGMRLKRSGSQSWECDNNVKIAKYDDSAKVQQKVGQMPSEAANVKFTWTSMDTSPNVAETISNVNPCPPNSTAIQSATTNTNQCFTTSNASSQARLPMYPAMLPIYYMPVPQSRQNPPHMGMVPQEYPGSPNRLSQPTSYCYVPVSYMPTAIPRVMYPSIIGAPAPPAMMYRSFNVPETIPAPPSEITVPTCPITTAAPTTTTTTGCFDLKHPASRATSDKAEPGSTKAMSESSKKILLPSGIISSCVSNEEECYFSSSTNQSCDSSSNMDQQPFTSSSEMDHKNKDDRGSQTRKALGMARKAPPWIEGVKVTPELIYQYQIKAKPLSEVLKSDLEFLKRTKQPSLVNDQLGQLFLDLDLEGFGSKLILEEAGSNSAIDSSSDGSQSPSRMGAW